MTASSVRIVFLSHLQWRNSPAPTCDYFLWSSILSHSLIHKEMCCYFIAERYQRIASNIMKFIYIKVIKKHFHLFLCRLHLLIMSK